MFNNKEKINNNYRKEQKDKWIKKVRDFNFFKEFQFYISKDEKKNRWGNSYKNKITQRRLPSLNFSHLNWIFFIWVFWKYLRKWIIKLYEKDQFI